MIHITYDEMVDMYGQAVAYALLRTVERNLDRQTGKVTLFDLGARLKQAFMATQIEAAA